MELFHSIWNKQRILIKQCSTPNVIHSIRSFHVFFFVFRFLFLFSFSNTKPLSNIEQAVRQPLFLRLNLKQYKCLLKCFQFSKKRMLSNIHSTKSEKKKQNSLHTHMRSTCCVSVCVCGGGAWIDLILVWIYVISHQNLISQFHWILFSSPHSPPFPL